MKQTITIEWDYGCSLDEFIDEYILDEMRCEIEDLDLSERTIERSLRILEKVKGHLKSYIREGTQII